MGIDIAAMFGDAEKSAAQGMSDLLKQGGNAGLGYLEQQAIDVIKADQAQHVAAYQDATKDALGKPIDPNSFSAYLGKITQNPVLQNYGPYIIGAVVVILLVGRSLK